MATAMDVARRRALGPLLGALLVAGCGGSAARSSPPASPGHGPPLTAAALLRAISATRAVSSAHENLTLALAGPTGSLHFTVDGTADFRTTTGSTIALSSRGQRAQAVFRDGTVWLTDNAPAFTRALPAGSGWVRASASELEAIGAFTPVSQSLTVLDVLRGVTSLRATGPGAASFTFSLPQAMARTPAAQRPALRNAIHVNGNPDVREVGSVALDGAGRVRSLSVVISGAGPSAGLFLGYTLAISAVDAPVRVTPPARSIALSSVPALAALLRGSAAGT